MSPQGPKDGVLLTIALVNNSLEVRLLVLRNSFSIYAELMVSFLAVHDLQCCNQQPELHAIHETLTDMHKIKQLVQKLLPRGVICSKELLCRYGK